MEKIKVNTRYLKRDIENIKILNNLIMEITNCSREQLISYIEDIVANYKMTCQLLEEMEFAYNEYIMYEEAINCMLEDELKVLRIGSRVQDSYEIMGEDIKCFVVEVRKIEEPLTAINKCLAYIKDIFSNMKKYWSGDVAEYFYDFFETEIMFEL